MEKNELKHDGLKGMKWGVRRYRNYDGTLTEAGKKRYYKDADASGYKEEGANGRRYRTTKKGKVEGFNADPDKWVREDLSDNKRVADESANAANRLKKLNDDAMRARPKKMMDLSNMSDKEMREQINRAMLERQYNDMFNQANVHKGQETVSRILEIGGDVLSVTGSALAITLAIIDIKKRMG